MTAFRSMSGTSLDRTFRTITRRWAIGILSCLLCPGAGALPQDLERFTSDGAVGYKDPRSGSVVIAPRYTAGSAFKQGVAVVVQDGKRGFIDTTGRVIIPLIYEDASLFCEDLASV